MERAMQQRLLSVLVSVVGLTPTVAFSAPSTNLDQEYDQVRRIALRDPKVRAAFESANQRLEAKIVEIDPALKGYAKGRTNVTSAISSTAAESAAPRKPFVKPSKSASSVNHSRTHVIASGDTLSTVAVHYKVTVAELKGANPSVDEKKLQVGDKLTIPSRQQHVAKPKQATTSTWDRLKSNFQ
jgi:LysM repeat protein